MSRERNGQTLFAICARLTMKHGLEMSRQAVTTAVFDDTCGNLIQIASR